MRLSSRALAVVLALALVAGARLVVVTRQYLAGIATLQQVEFTVGEARWESDERLVVTLTIANRGDLDLSVESLTLTATLDPPSRGRLGATANRDNPYRPVPVPARETARATWVIAVIRPELVSGPERDRQPLRFDGEAALLLPNGTRTFTRPVTLRWSPPQ